MDAAKADERITPFRASFRDRAFAILTANMAVVFALAGWYGSEQYVLKVNSSRVLGLAALSLKTKILASRPRTDETAETHHEDEGVTLEKQIGVTAVIAYVWKYLMYVVAAILEAAAVMSATTHYARGALRIAGWVILFSTLCTLVATTLLVNPSYGGMPPLSPRSYIYAALLQGGYGLILLLAYWPRQEPAS
jgi:hypothetical protein